MSVPAECEDDLNPQDLLVTEPGPPLSGSEGEDDQSASSEGPGIETVDQISPPRHQLDKIKMKSVNNVLKEKSSLLHTKSYLMNSLLHLQDRSRILLQLSKQADLESHNRNIYHGKIYNYVLPAPRVFWTRRTQVSTVTELLDRLDVVEDKVLYLATLLRVSSKTVVYTGAGVSTSSGVRQRAPGSGKVGRSLTTNALPSPAHYLLAEMVRTGLVHTWVTLCCDGLAQKAGCPQQRLLELHGSWYDPSNPVLRQGGRARSDIREAVTELEETADLVVVMGSSLTGHHPLVSTTASRAARGESLGTVIVNLQQTGQDPAASLRLFSQTDHVCQVLASRLDIKVRKPDIKRTIEHRAWVRYDPGGERQEEGGMWLDLSPGQEVRLNPRHNCQNTGQESLLHLARGRGRVVRYCPTQRAWELEVEGVKMLLGYWWLQASTSTTGPNLLPVINCKPRLK